MPDSRIPWTPAALATMRMLTEAEAFIGGQLLAQFQHATRATMLGKKGRYYVISEEEIERAQAGGTNGG